MTAGIGPQAFVSIPYTLKSAVHITAPTVVKASKGYLESINVITAGSTVGTVNDCTTTGAAAIANQIGSIPETVGPQTIRMPFQNGLVIVPGTGQVLSLSFQ